MPASFIPGLRPLARRPVGRLAIRRASSASAAATSVVGKLGDEVDRWRRDLVREQTELGGLHGCPPHTVTAVQPARVVLRTRRATRPPASRRGQIRQRPQRRRPARCRRRCRGGRFVVGPRRGQQRLGPVGQHHQQLQSAVAAHPTQHPQLLPGQRVPRPGDQHRRRRRRRRRPTRPRGMAAPRRAARPRRPASGWPRPTRSARRRGRPHAGGQARGDPQHRGLATRAPQPPGLQRADRARQSTTAITVPVHPAPACTNRSTNSSRPSQTRCPISSSAAACAQYSPSACARNAAARSSMRVVSRGFLRRDLPPRPAGAGAAAHRR